MNLLEKLPKRTVSKVGKTEKYSNSSFFSYDKRTVHYGLIDRRTLVFSDIPGNTEMTVEEILNKKR